MKLKRAVVNYADGRHLRGQKRLVQSLKSSNWNITTIEHISNIPRWVEDFFRHKNNPYGFKLFAINEFKRYESILYLDASVYGIKNIDPLFDIIEKDGYLMQNSGWKVGQWANDNCLDYFEITREEAMQMDMYGDAGLLGLNFNTDIANEFFDRWMQSCKDGAFKGSWDNHRHDMTCGSIIANQLGMKYLDEPVLAYAAPHEEVGENIILKAQGI